MAPVVDPLNDVGLNAVGSEAEHQPSIETIHFSVLPPLTPEQEQAIRARSAEQRRYAEVLISQDPARLAELLREEGLPLHIRLEIADIIDPGRRWYPKWKVHDARMEALSADDPEQLLKTQ